jgi:mannose-6-phosphate isomerase-like protein (cupin superfamily)
MSPVIQKANPSTEFETAERCFITELLNDENDPTVSIARARVEPGVTTAWHQLTGTAERYLILSGQGCVDVDGLTPADVTAYDVVSIPPDTPQRITNTGEEDLIFLAICTPRFTPECYRSLE